MKNGKVYYTARDYGDDIVIKTVEKHVNSSLDVLTAIGKSSKVGNTQMYQIILTWTIKNTGVSYPIEKVYYNDPNKGADIWIEIDDFKYEDSQISFIMYEYQEYKFKIKDSSGATIETTTPIVWGN